MSAHIAVRPALSLSDEDAGCFVVCAQHELRAGFGSLYRAATTACKEHNLAFH